ncbi:MAG TPA: hypothetical protein VJJ83_03065, partial [Candidatus Babeliales bacterium]|nr:hypothetical protein [Candidatus Babeliales bacterium]
LGIYKLLALSLNNPAFASQLEADLLLAFADPTAELKYLQAAELYLAQNEVGIAVAIYEHLITLNADNLEYVALRQKALALL